MSQRVELRDLSDAEFEVGDTISFLNKGERLTGIVVHVLSKTNYHVEVIERYDVSAPEDEPKHVLGDPKTTVESHQLKMALQEIHKLRAKVVRLRQAVDFKNDRIATLERIRFDELNINPRISRHPLASYPFYNGEAGHIMVEDDKQMDFIKAIIDEEMLND